MSKEYVAGFYFSKDRKKLALIRKNKPEWQAGSLNGIGGKVMKGEKLYTAMVREFLEEAGKKVTGWSRFCTLAGDFGVVHFYKAFGSMDRIRTNEEEEVVIGDVNDFMTNPDIDMIYNLYWLIPMALDEVDAKVFQRRN